VCVRKHRQVLLRVEIESANTQVLQLFKRLNISALYSRRPFVKLLNRALDQLLVNANFSLGSRLKSSVKNETIASGPDNLCRAQKLPTHFHVQFSLAIAVKFLRVTVIFMLKIQFEPQVVLKGSQSRGQF
jgi:hypothetical protein